MQKGNLFDRIPADLSEELFEPLVENQFVRIERIISNGHTSPEQGWYDQPQREWVVILQGEARIAFADDETVELCIGWQAQIYCTSLKVRVFFIPMLLYSSFL